MVSDNNSDSNNKKESEDLPLDAPVPRLCHIVKWPDFDGFGFNLQLGQYIGKVDPDSPAELADLREGDRIIEVNGVAISNENHKQVVQRIKSVPNETKLLVINQKDYEWYNDRNLIIRSTQSNVIYCKTPVPRPAFVNEAENKIDQMNSTKSESLSESLNTNESSDLKVDDPKSDQEDSPLADEIFNVLEAKKSFTSSADEIANKLSSTKLQSEATPNSTIESNNNSEKTANQNLVSPMKNAPQKSHNFIVVDSEAEFAAEKRFKDEQIKNSLMNNNSTPIKLADKEQQLNNNHTNSSTTNSISSSNNLSLNPMNKSDLNLDMSASEMRQLISSRRNVKADCKKQPLDLKQKYEIIQQM